VCYLRPQQVARYEAAGDDEYFAEVPVLCAEVISPSETAAYINEKTNDYLTGGARLIWLLFPRTKEVQVFRPRQPIFIVAGDGELDGGEVLPGFSVRVASLFS
jgi:Uma2 family endonuclease